MQHYKHDLSNKYTRNLFKAAALSTKFKLCLKNSDRIFKFQLDYALVILKIKYNHNHLAC